MPPKLYVLTYEQYKGTVRVCQQERATPMTHQFRRITERGADRSACTCGWDDDQTWNDLHLAMSAWADHHLAPRLNKIEQDAAALIAELDTPHMRRRMNITAAKGA